MVNLSDPLPTLHLLPGWWAVPTTLIGKIGESNSSTAHPTSTLAFCLSKSTPDSLNN
ncbi:MAG: hypothetical protein F6K56_37860 [Moorea sp. SIO3G5]|nr:hypothetical protein [Moorena sp. SIO3G5]